MEKLEPPHGLSMAQRRCKLRNAAQVCVTGYVHVFNKISEKSKKKIRGKNNVQRMTLLCKPTLVSTPGQERTGNPHFHPLLLHGVSRCLFPFLNLLWRCLDQQTKSCALSALPSSQLPASRYSNPRYHGWISRNPPQPASLPTWPWPVSAGLIFV